MLSSFALLFAVIAVAVAAPLKKPFIDSSYVAEMSIVQNRQIEARVVFDFNATSPRHSRSLMQATFIDVRNFCFCFFFGATCLLFLCTRAACGESAADFFVLLLCQQCVRRTRAL